MSKINITGLEARNKAIKGLSFVAASIKSTIGPFGLNFALEKGNKITNDGKIISAELCPTIGDEFERRGALIAHEASSKTEDMVGDFSSGTWALTEAIVKEAVRYLPNEKTFKAKKTPAEIIKWIEKSKNEVVAALKQQVKPVPDKESLVLSALVSSEDEEMAKLLGEMQWELGPDGVIIAEEVNEPSCSIERVNGIRIDNGFGASYFVTNPEKQAVELSNIHVLMTNYTMGVEELNALKEPVFNHLINKKQGAIAIIARAFTSDAIKLCGESMKTGFAIFPINAPYVNQSEIMKDIETVIGGRYIDIEQASLADIFITDIGFAKTLNATQFDARVAGTKNAESDARVVKRTEELTQKLKGEPSEFYKRMIEARIAQLTHGYAILKVGSLSVTDRKRLKDKADDSVRAVQLALKGGTVKGAGQALKEIGEQLTEDNILKRPLSVIHDQIMLSAPEDYVIGDWVRDPFLVLKCGLENACAFAGTFSTINGIITEENKPKCNCAINQNNPE